MRAAITADGGFLALGRDHATQGRSQRTSWMPGYRKGSVADLPVVAFAEVTCADDRGRAHECQGYLS